MMRICAENSSASYTVVAGACMSFCRQEGRHTLSRVMSIGLEKRQAQAITRKHVETHESARERNQRGAVK